MKSSGIRTNSCRFDTQIHGLNQGAHNMTHSIAGSPLWDPNSPEALSSVVSDYRTSYFWELTKRNLTNSIQFYSRIYHLFWKMFGIPWAVQLAQRYVLEHCLLSLGIALQSICLAQKKKHSFAFCQICMVVRPPQTQVKAISLEFDWYHVWPAKVCEDFGTGNISATVLYKNTCWFARHP